MQAKRWKGKVGIVRDSGGPPRNGHKGAEIAVVTTNSHFTPAAKAATKKVPGITLVDREELKRMIHEVFPPDVPEFDWGKYNEYVRDWQPPPPVPIPGQYSPPGASRARIGENLGAKPRGGYRRGR